MDLAPFARMVNTPPPPRISLFKLTSKQDDPVVLPSSNGHASQQQHEEEEEDLLAAKPPLSPPAAPPPTTTNNAQTSALHARNMQIETKTFWLEHEKWSKQISRLTLLSLDEPVQAARTLSNPNPPFTYLIKTSPGGGEGVRRRYSDFELVRSQLALRYPGILQLQLPEKAALGKSNDVFLQERAKGLRLYLEFALQVDFFQADSLFRDFLLLPAQEWEAAKKSLLISATAAAATAQQQQDVQERFRNAVSMTPALPDDVVNKTYDAVVRLELILRTMHTSGQRVLQCARAHSAAVADLHRQVLLAASVASPLNIPLEAWKEAAQIEPVVLEEWFLDAIARQLDLVAAMRLLLDTRRALAQTADNKLAVLHKFEVEVEQNLKRGIPAMASQQRVQDATRQLKDASYQLEFFTKALYFNGLANFVESSARGIQTLLAKFATAQLRVEERAMRDVWHSFLSTFKLELQVLEGKTLVAVQEKLPAQFKQVFE